MHESASKLALLAARLMYDRTEKEYFTAKRKAARQLGVEYRYRPKISLPTAKSATTFSSLHKFMKAILA